MPPSHYPPKGPAGSTHLPTLLQASQGTLTVNPSTSDIDFVVSKLHWSQRWEHDIR